MTPDRAFEFEGEHWQRANAELADLRARLARAVRAIDTAAALLTRAEPRVPAEPVYARAVVAEVGRYLRQAARDLAAPPAPPAAPARVAPTLELYRG